MGLPRLAANVRGVAAVTAHLEFTGGDVHHFPQRTYRDIISIVGVIRSRGVGDEVAGEGNRPIGLNAWGKDGYAQKQQRRHQRHHSYYMVKQFANFHFYISLPYYIPMVLLASNCGWKFGLAPPGSHPSGKGQ